MVILTCQCERSGLVITLNIHLETNSGDLTVPVRWTVSLVSIDGQWRWVHRHASFAAISQEDGTAYPVGERS